MEAESTAINEAVSLEHAVECAGHEKGKGDQGGCEQGDVGRATAIDPRHLRRTQAIASHVSRMRGPHRMPELMTPIIEITTIKVSN